MEFDPDDLEPIAIYKHPLRSDEDPIEEEFEGIVVQNAVINRKNLLQNSSNHFLQNRNDVLKKLERNKFRLELKLFMSMLIIKDDYYIESYWMDRGRHLLIKEIEGDSCLEQQKSQEPRLVLKY